MTQSGVYFVIFFSECAEEEKIEFQFFIVIQLCVSERS